MESVHALAHVASLGDETVFVAFSEKHYFGARRQNRPKSSPHETWSVP